MGKDYFKDGTTFENRYCEKCSSVYQHRVLSRWAVPPVEGQKLKIPPSSWKYEREIVARCTNCFPFVARNNK
jgi:hypothetical protein